jgi:uncharacterized protein DUF4124
MRFSLFIFMIFLMHALLPEAWGQIYQYTDKNGNMVFSDRPPSGVNAKEKQLTEDGVYWSNRRESDYPSFQESKETPSGPAREET